MHLVANRQGKSTLLLLLTQYVYMLIVGLYNLQDLIYGDKIGKHSLIKLFHIKKCYVFFCIFSIYNYDFVIVTMTNLLQSSCIMLKEIISS